MQKNQRMVGELGKHSFPSFQDLDDRPQEEYTATSTTIALSVLKPSTQVSFPYVYLLFRDKQLHYPHGIMSISSLSKFPSTHQQTDPFLPLASITDSGGFLEISHSHTLLIREKRCPPFRKMNVLKLSVVVVGMILRQMKKATVLWLSPPLPKFTCQAAWFPMRSARDEPVTQLPVYPQMDASVVFSCAFSPRISFCITGSTLKRNQQELQGTLNGYIFLVNNLFEVFTFRNSQVRRQQDWGQHSLGTNSARTVKCSSSQRCGFYFQLLLFFQLSLVPFFGWPPHI